MHKALFAIGLVALAASATALFFPDQTPLSSTSQPPDTVNLPELTPGTQATYTATGEYQTLIGNAIVGNDSHLGPNTSLTVHVTQAPLPGSYGTLHPSTVVQVEHDERVLVATAGDDGIPRLEFDPEHDTDENDPFDPVARIQIAQKTDGEPVEDPWDLSGDGGFADSLILDGLEAPTSPEALGNRSPIVAQLAQAYDDGYFANLTVEATPQTEDRTTVEVRYADELEAAYTFTPDCPLPRTVEYTDQYGDTAFEAQRTRCTTGAHAASTQTSQERAWPKPSTETVERTFPGQGENLPLEYRGALEFFLSTPNTQLWTDANPDWVLGCAALQRRGDDAHLADFSWRFDLVGEASNRTGWVTRTDTPNGVLDRWIRDPDPPQIDPQSPCQKFIASGPGPRGLPGMQMVPVGDTYPIYQALVDETAMEGEARLESIQFGPLGTGYKLSRCGIYLEEQGGGICSASMPTIHLELDGRVDSVHLEQAHYSGLFDPLVHLPDG